MIGDATRLVAIWVYATIAVAVALTATLALARSLDKARA